MKKYVRKRRPEWFFITALAIALGIAVFAFAMARAGG